MSAQPTPVDDKRKRDEVRFWSKVAPQYDDWISAAFMEQYKAFKAGMTGLVNEEDMVLDIATGTGNIALHIAPRVSAIVGIDISEDMIAVAEGKLEASGLENVTFLVEDAYNLPFADGSFDKVVCVNGLQTMVEPLQAIKEGTRVLRDGGEFISVTYAYGDSGPIEYLKLSRWVIKYGKPKYWSNFKTKDLRGLFEEAGLEIVESKRIWDKPVVEMVRARKPI